MKRIYIGFVALVFMTGCNKFDSDLNVNPNQPTIASGTQLIANAQLFLPGLSSSPDGEFYAQYLAETQYINASLYTQIAYNFYGLYQGPLMNLEKVIQDPEVAQTADGPVVNQAAVAKILRAVFYRFITDRWGDVPYSEALKGRDDFTPKYDSQESIYDDLFIQLKEANDEIVSGNITNDIIYNGNMEDWRKLANSLRMLMALRISEVNPTKGQAEFQAAMNDGVMTSNTGNFTFNHLNEEMNQNYWYGQIVTQGRDWWAISKNLADMMIANEDPRLYVYADENEVGGYEGLEYGRPEGWESRTPSLLGPAIYEQNAPVHLITYSQILFAQAEAALRNWIPGGAALAKTNYDSAIEASLAMWGADTDALATMMDKPAVAFNPATGLEQIATQRYIHLYMNGYEAWSEWRRTGYPQLVSPGGKGVPLRQGYPEEEKFNNTENYDQAIQAQFGGEDTLYGRVWWDKD